MLYADMKVTWDMLDPTEIQFLRILSHDMEKLEKSLKSGGVCLNPDLGANATRAVINILVKAYERCELQVSETLKEIGD